MGADAIEGIHAFYEQWKSTIVYYEKEELIQKMKLQDPEFLKNWFHSLLIV